MGKCTNLSGSLTTTLLVALQEVAELVVVLPLLLFDRYDILESLPELL